MVQIRVGSSALCVLPGGLDFTLLGFNPLLGFLWGHSIARLLKYPSCAQSSSRLTFYFSHRESLGWFPWSDPISHLPVCPCLLENTWMRPFSCLLVNPGLIPFCCVFDISWFCLLHSRGYSHSWSSLQGQDFTLFLLKVKHYSS